MSKDLKGIDSWLSTNRLTLNVLKTDFMVIGSRQRVASLEKDIALSLLGLGQTSDLSRVEYI